MGFYRQKFKIIQGDDADAVAKQVEERLAQGYDLHGDLSVVAVVLLDAPNYVLYVQAVIKSGERAYG